MRKLAFRHLEKGAPRYPTLEDVRRRSFLGVVGAGALAAASLVSAGCNSVFPAQSNELGGGPPLTLPEVGSAAIPDAGAANEPVIAPPLGGVPPPMLSAPDAGARRSPGKGEKKS